MKNRSSASRMQALEVEKELSAMQARIKEADDLLYVFSFMAETLAHKGCVLQGCEYKQAAAYVKKYKVVSE